MKLFPTLAVLVDVATAGGPVPTYAPCDASTGPTMESILADGLSADMEGFTWTLGTSLSLAAGGESWSFGHLITLREGINQAYFDVDGDDDVFCPNGNPHLGPTLVDFQEDCNVEPAIVDAGWDNNLYYNGQFEGACTTIIKVTGMCCSAEAPSDAPTIPTESPTSSPTESPTGPPSESPSEMPSEAPSTKVPTKAPTEVPNVAPTGPPTGCVPVFVKSAGNCTKPLTSEECEGAANELGHNWDQTPINTDIMYKPFDHIPGGCFAKKDKRKEKIIKMRYNSHTDPGTNCGQDTKEGNFTKLCVCCA